MSSEQYKKTTTTNEPILGSSTTTTKHDTTYTTAHPQTSSAYTNSTSPVTEQRHTTLEPVHPTGIRHEPTKSHTVEQTDVNAPKKWSEEASMVGSDVREGLGKYKDVRPTTGATEYEQSRGTGVVHETGHADASVYRPQDMTDTASKVGSDQREGLGTAAKVEHATTVDKGYVEKKHVEKEHKYKPHKHEKQEHHHKHDAYPAATTTHITSPFTTSHTTTHEAYPSPSTTTYDTKPTTYAGTGYPGSTTTSYEKTDTSGTPSTHYQYIDKDIGDKPTYRGTTTDYGSIHKGTGMGGYADPAYGGDYQESSKFGSDKREGLGTGAAYGTSSHTAGEQKTGWSDTASKPASDIREGLGSGTHTTQGGQYQ